MIRSALSSKQLAECRVITHHVKMPETACTTPYTCKQPQYELKRFITPVGTLNRNAVLFKMLIEMASLKHLEEQEKTAKGVISLFTNFIPNWSLESKAISFCCRTDWLSLLSKA